MDSQGVPVTFSFEMDIYCKLQKFFGWLRATFVSFMYTETRSVSNREVRQC